MSVFSMTRTAGLAVALVLTVVSAEGCRHTRSVVLSGSGTMAPLAWKWAREFMRGHAGVTVRVESTDSSAGIKALAGGGADICMSSRPLTREEAQMVKARRGTGPSETAVALDAVAVFVNMKNPIDRLTMDELRDIYTGKIVDWKQAGGQKGPLIAYGYAPGSGTRAWWKEKVLGGADESPQIREFSGAEELVAAVAADARAVGYGSPAFVKGVRIVRVARKPVERGMEPSDASMSAGKYPLGRQLFMCVAGAPSADTTAFLEWVLSSEGQRMCRNAGYFPVHKGVHFTAE